MQLEQVNYTNYLAHVVETKVFYYWN